ncbi:hypothetical protein JX265_011548 [Neoarthrinium moseri]|uniref:laccase n=1 Tax=Neoarthrinium moseri TaxID=1658444 RepID=A0A9P9WBY4_9PEZI|nr:hypothetical protein JX266_005457 [Neoarthrinium moseri]KAI1856589.1 hypothetical protein JX265_011548 [Neoarthrinium moseri]
MLTLFLRASLFGLSLGFPSLPSPHLFPRASCSGNTADTRSEWCDYSIDTDYTTTAPDTGVTREYWFELTETTASPDGVERYVQAINGSIPGPTIFADWGDTVVVHVTNSITSSNNGTSIHFHGIRQNYTNQNDGVSSITQCPTAPGSTITYTWRALQYGSTWYHSHWALQAWEGVFGGIVINGPATSNYDEDLGILFLNDWDHSTVDQLYTTAETSGPPTLDNGLINGTNVYGDDEDASQTGSRFTVSVTEETSYRIRIVNAAIDSHFKFMIDNHTLTVIAMDLVPITPFTTDILSIAMGQRYDVIVTANQASVADSFWMRAIPQSACSENDSQDNIKGIVYYGDSTTTPTTSRPDGYSEDCEDMDVSNLVPYISQTVTSASSEGVESATVGFNDNNFFKWYLNSTTMLVEWSDPTLLQIYDNVTSFDTSDAVIELPDANEWVYIVIQTTFAVPHPIHLHGHDFLIIAQGSGTYSSDVTLNLDNPPRRDTAMLPASGYLAIAFQTDNPGAWLMHCHIGWHTSEGFALQFVERQDEINALIDYDSLSDNCNAWETYVGTSSIEQDDSGV